ncbi:hypothetical protein CEXT_264561 [Caerostris extrusa]|uniref:Uncharacterized protein n=1 Tax=Caerostris extrusa TaxID=172846 RepID=A0AAV4S7N5_CAEEX|nr:hypothetical protein CEXT_264561 [Caerostris extrusa]
MKKHAQGGKFKLISNKWKDDCEGSMIGKWLTLLFPLSELPPIMVHPMASLTVTSRKFNEHFKETVKITLAREVLKSLAINAEQINYYVSQKQLYESRWSSVYRRDVGRIRYRKIPEVENVFRTFENNHATSMRTVEHVLNVNRSTIWRTLNDEKCICIICRECTYETGSLSIGVNFARWFLQQAVVSPARLIYR